MTDKGSKRVLRYCKGTINSKLIYKQGEELVATIMSDSDLAKDPHNNSRNHKN